MRKLAVSQSKGGVGKSTTAVNLSAGLAEAGLSVLLVDTDTQGQASSMLGVQAPGGLAELMLGEPSPTDVLVQARPNLTLLAGGRALAGVKQLIARKDFGAERTLGEALAPYEGLFDLVVLDTGPGWDALTVNVLFYAHEILSPVSLEVLTVIGLVEFRNSLEAVQRYHESLALRYVLPTFLDGRVKKSDEILGQLAAHYGDQLCTPIRYNVRLSEAPGFGQTIFEYAPRSTGAADYRALTERVRTNGRS